MDPEDVKAGLVTAAGLPTPEAGDAGKVLVVNEDEDGFVLGEAGGEKLYRHNISFFVKSSAVVSSQDGIKCFAEIINRSNTAYTETTLKTYVANLTSHNRVLPVTCPAFVSDSVFVNATAIIYPYALNTNMSGTMLRLAATSSSFTTDGSTVTINPNSFAINIENPIGSQFSDSIEEI